MKNIHLSRRLVVGLFILTLPILLFVYNPSLRLGGFGLLLGVIGMTISPAILIGVFVYLIYKADK